MGARHIIMGCAALAAMAGCKNDQPEAMKTDPAFATASAQLTHGATVFANNCAKCHGVQGQGGPTPDGGHAPALVGKDALPLRRAGAKFRTGEFRTAQDIANFVTKNMPPSPEARAKLTERDYWAVLAFALNANGVKLSEPVGPNNASSIKIH